MSLDRPDLLQKGIKAKSHADTVLASGYIAKSVNSNRKYVAVLFYGGVRLKGYFNIADLQAVADGRVGKAVIKKTYSSV